MTTCVLNSLPSSWTSFETNIYSNNDTKHVYELWAKCILEEYRIKAKNDNE